MGTFLQVDLDVLSNAARSMTQAAQLLSDVRESMSKDAGKVIGPGDLNNAADDFQSEWRYGAEQLEEGVTATAQGLKNSHDGYQSVDQATTAALKQAGQPR